MRQRRGADRPPTPLARLYPAPSQVHWLCAPLRLFIEARARQRVGSLEGWWEGWRSVHAPCAYVAAVCDPSPRPPACSPAHAPPPSLRPARPLPPCCMPSYYNHRELSKREGPRGVISEHGRKRWRRRRDTARMPRPRAAKVSACARSQRARERERERYSTGRG